MTKWAYITAEISSTDRLQTFNLEVFGDVRIPEGERGNLAGPHSSPYPYLDALGLHGWEAYQVERFNGGLRVYLKREI